MSRSSLQTNVLFAIMIVRDMAVSVRNHTFSCFNCDITCFFKISFDKIIDNIKKYPVIPATRNGDFLTFCF